MLVVFYKVDNSKEYDRHTFDGWRKEETLKALYELPDDEVRSYDMEHYTLSGKYGMNPNAIDFEEDYNNEELDGGWWCVVIP